MQREYLQNRNNFIRAVSADEKEKDEKKAPSHKDVSIYFVGAFIERPRATNGRPYG